jgi:hypothetical protein
MRYLRMLGLVGLVVGAMLGLAGGASATELTSPAGTKLEAESELKAESEGAVEFAGSINFSCQKSAIEGKISNAGGKETTVSASLSKLSLTECGNHTVTVLNPGSLELHDSGNGNGTLTSTGAEITLLTHSVFLGTIHCVYVIEATDLGTLTGSSTTGATATLDIGGISLERISTDVDCGSHSTFGGSYQFTSPDFLDVDEGPPALTSPEGTKVLAGAKIHAESSHTQLTGSLTVTCEKSTVGGSVTTNDINEAGGTIETLTFEECGGDTVDVLSKGTLTLTGSNGTTGTVTSSGAEVTVLTHRPFIGTVHCIYATKENHIGSFTESHHNPGTGAHSTATIHANSVNLTRTTTSFGCGTHSTWDGTYAVTNPDQLYID